MSVSIEELLAKSVEEGLSIATAMQWWAHSASTPDPALPVASNAYDGAGARQGFLGHWARKCSGQSYGWRDFDAALESICQQVGSGWMTQKDRHGATPFSLRMDQLDTGNCTPWIRLAPAECLSWKSKGYNPHPLIVRILDAGNDEALDVAISRGLSLLSTSQGHPVAIWIKTPHAWNTFLAEGGDPFQLVHSRSHEDRKITLWERLSAESTHPELSSEVERWAAGNASGELEARKTKEYWDGLLRAYNAQSVASALRSRPDWAALCDDQGRPAAWIAALRHASIISRLPAKAKPVLHTLDHHGGNAWQLACWSAAGGAIASTLVKEELPIQASPVTGRGLLVQSLSVPRPTGTTHSHFLRSPSLAKSLLRQDPAPEALLGADDEGAAAFCRWQCQDAYWWGKGSSPDEVENMAYIAKHASSSGWQLHPLVHTALAHALTVCMNPHLAEEQGAFEYHVSRAAPLPSMAERQGDWTARLEKMPKHRASWEQVALSQAITPVAYRQRARM